MTKERMPKRDEVSVCPGLVELIEDVAGDIEAGVALRHAGMDHHGSWGMCPLGECAPLRHWAERLRAGLTEWGG